MQFTSYVQGFYGLKRILIQSFELTLPASSVVPVTNFYHSFNRFFILPRCMTSSCFGKTGFLIIFCFFLRCFNGHLLAAPLPAGTDASNALDYQVPGSPDAMLSLVGPNVICSGQNASFQITVTGGTAPCTYVIAINGVPQPPVSTNSNPINFQLPVNAPILITLASLTANGIPATVSGAAFVSVAPSLDGQILHGDTTFCNGQSDSLRFKFHGTGPFSFVFAENGVNHAPITTSDTAFAQAVTPPPGFNQYTLVSVSANGCSGLVSGKDTIRVLPTPTAVISGDTSICPGSTAKITIHLTGAKPFIIKYMADGVLQPTVITDTTVYTFLVTPATTTTYDLKSVVSSGGCVGTVSGQATATVQTGPTATLSGGGQICQSGSGTVIIFTLTGTGPWTFVYKANNIVQPPVTTTDPLVIISVNPVVGTIYNLISVHDATCSGIASGTAIVFVFTPPTAVMTGSQVFCDSAKTDVSVDFTGTGPFTFTYTIDGVPQTPINTFDDPYLIPASTTTTTTYVLTSVSSPGCVGLPTGSATLTVHYTPKYNNVVWNCNPSGGNYTVEFDVTGTVPITLVTGSGTFTGKHFVSNPIPQAQGFNFVFHDADNCGNVTVNGISNCNCTTKAGTMDTAPINACMGQAATAIYHNDFVNDGNDILRFILHTNPGNPIGTILSWSATPTFTNIPGVIPGVTYYISPVAGNADGAGNVDLTDQCFALAQGAPVVFHVLPKAAPGPDLAVCAGSNAQIQVVLTGQAPFTLQWTENGTSLMASNLPGPNYVLSVHPILNTTVVIQSVSDSLCTVALPDTVQVGLLTAPQVSNMLDSCHHANATYTVEFDVAGTPPFTVSGLTGTFTGNHFTSTPLASGAAYNFTLQDVNNCGSVSGSGSSVCSCLTNAGTVDATPLSICTNDTAKTIFHNDYFNDGNDLFRFILHTNPGAPIGTILAWSNTPVFSYNNAYQTGVTYYISAIAGNPDGLGNIDLSDPCLSVSAGTPVIFHALPTAQLGADVAICQGSSAFLQVKLTGQQPFMLDWTVNGTPQSIGTIPSTTYLLSFMPLLNSTVILKSVSDAFCSAIIADTANIVVTPTPVVQNVQDSCDYTNGQYIVSFDITGTAPFTIGGMAGDFDGMHFVSFPLPSGTPYSITVTDSGNCGQAALSNTPVCPCKADAGILVTTPQVLCGGQVATALYQPGSSPVLAPNDTLVYELLSSAFAIIATSHQPSFAFNPATMFPDSVYTIVGLVGKILPDTSGIDYSDGCLSTAIGPTVIWRAIPTATIVGNATICPGNPASLEVDLTGSGPFTFTYTANGTPGTINATSVNPYFIIDHPSVATTYQLASLTGAGGCPGTVSGSGQVDIDQLPQVVHITSSCDFFASTYILQFDISNGASPNPNYTVTGITGTLTDTSFISGPIIFGTPYNITVTNDNGCSAVATGSISCQCGTSAGTLNPAHLNACLPDGHVTGIYNHDGTLVANDSLVFILCKTPSLLPQGILAFGNTPDFGFQNGMTAGTTYFIVAVAGTPGSVAGINWTDPCLSISPATPVTFHLPPTASMQGDTAICRGKSYNFKIKFQGAAPFTFVYAINGVPQIPITAPQASFNVSTNNVQQDQIFTLISVTDAYCTGTAAGKVTVKVLENLAGGLTGDSTICAGDSALIALHLSGTDSFYVRIQGGIAPIVLNGVVNGSTLPVFPGTTTTYVIDSISAIGNHCPFTIGKDVIIQVTKLAITGMVSDYHGFGVSCADMTDSSISLTTSGGAVPITAAWSNGNSGLSLANLPPGHYTVVAKDLHGCLDSGSYDLKAPPPLAFSIKSRNPKCSDKNKGVIEIGAISGGVQPYLVGINGNMMQPTGFPYKVDQLADGTYTVEVTDNNGCTSDAQAVITTPPLPLVDLGPDQEQYPGDSTLLTGILSITKLDTFFWTPTKFMSDPKSLTTYVKPDYTQGYTLSIRDTSGCTASDQVLVIYKKTPRVYIPNVFHPGNSGRNTHFTVFGGPEVVRIRHMQVFDRWGDLVFDKSDFPPNVPLEGWDGKADGKEVNPGVFLYIVDLEFVKGDTDIRSGDVTVVR
jgi:hypothetical protein